MTGQGFTLIQKFAMVVLVDPLQTWRQRREAGSQQTTVSAGIIQSRGSLYPTRVSAGSLGVGDPFEPPASPGVI